MYQRYVGIVSAVVVVVAAAGLAAEAQTGKKGGGRTAASATYRTLTGKVTDVKAGEQSVTVDAAEGAKGSQAWVLSVGRQTLLLRAGRNNQYAAAELGELKKGDTVQAVANLVADPADRTHATWWLVVYPEGVKPPTR
jgi:hypothetical protein